MKQATQSVWLTANGKLVAAGHPEAALLFLAKGHSIPDAELKPYGKSADKFFGEPQQEDKSTVERKGSVRIKRG